MRFILATCILIMIDAPVAIAQGTTAPTTSPTAAQAAPVGDAARAARAVLDEVAAVYRNAGAITDAPVLTQEVAGRSWDINFTLALGPGVEAQVSSGDERLTAFDQKLIITHDSAPNKYFETPLDKNIAQAMLTVPGWGPSALPHLALRYGAVSDNPTMAFNLGMPLRQQVVEHRLVERDGGSVLEIRFTGTTSETTAWVDPETKLVQQIRTTYMLRGEQASTAKIVTLRMKPQVHDHLPAPISIDTSARRRVTDIARLVPLDAGDVIADAEFQTIDGRTIHLKDHRGSAVVLGFWAGWCGPCRDSLPLLNGLDRWAKGAGKPIVVYAVNAREVIDPSKDDPQARLASAKQFWSTTGYSVPVVLDARDGLYKQFGFGDIPAMIVIVAPDGRITTTRSTLGLEPADHDAFIDQLKIDARAALGKSG